MASTVWPDSCRVLAKLMAAMSLCGVGAKKKPRCKQATAYNTKNAHSGIRALTSQRRAVVLALFRTLAASPRARQYRPDAVLTTQSVGVLARALCSRALICQKSVELDTEDVLLSSPDIHAGYLP